MKHLQQLFTFVRVAEAGSFAGAARSLDVDPSAASKHVAQLEAELGTALFERSPRRLRLTAAGRAILEHARQAEAEVIAARASVGELQEAPRGRLRVSAPPGLVAGLVIPWLPEFRQRYPGIELELAAENRFVDLAAEGFDLALRVTEHPADGVVARKLADMRLTACAAPRYLAQRGLPHEPLDLLDHDCLQFIPSSSPAPTVFERDGQRVEVPLRSRLRINHAEPLHSLVLGGLGIALLSHHLVRDELRRGELVRVLPQWRAVVGTALYAVYLPNRYGTPKLRAFVDFLVAKFAPRGERDAPSRQGRN